MILTTCAACAAPLAHTAPRCVRCHTRYCDQTYEALRLRRDVYSGRLKLDGKRHENTLNAANNYAATLLSLKRFEQVKSLMRKTVPVARSVLGDSNGNTIRMRSAYAEALYRDIDATLDDLRESVETYEQVARTARRVFGGAHPITEGVGLELLGARAALRAREMPPAGPRA